MRLRLLALLGISVIAGSLAAYMHRGGESVAAAAATMARAHAGSGQAFSVPRGCPVPKRYRNAFVTAAYDTGLPLSLLVAVAQTESRFRAKAVSGANAHGLLQVLPTTGAALRLNVDAPASNVLAGARYLQQLVNRFRSADLALAAYNAGPTAVSKAGGAPTAETQTYVANVNTRWRLLSICDGA
jgi:soluble lytic murein transglycosylase-like protein